MSITPETVQIVRPDDHPVLTASMVDYEGEEVPINNVTYESSDPGVVEVNASGRLSARRSGEAYIIAKTKTDEVKVKVQVHLISVASPL